MSKYLVKKLTLAILLTTSLVLYLPTDVNAKSFSSSSSSSSSSSQSNPSRANQSRPSTNVKINTVKDSGNQKSLEINSGASNITKPVTATYKTQEVNKIAPPNATIIPKTYNAPNPSNKPTETKVITRYDDKGKPFSLNIVVPIGAPIESYNTGYNSYFPANVNSGYITPRTTTTIIDNTPTNGWDVLSFFIIIGVIALVLVVVIIIFK